MNSAQRDILASDSAAPEPIVLCVDDEESVLSSLKRALRKQPFTLLTANSGEEALTLMADNTVDLIISDMRMPSMSGVQLLSKVYDTWPDTVRILLTGYADMESTVSAINDCHIFRYLNKPWNNDGLLVAINSALEHKHLKDENTALTELTKKQNAELLAFNAKLESKVDERTRELAEANDQLNQFYAELSDSYQSAIRVFAQLIELRESGTRHHSQKVAETCAKLSEVLTMSDAERSDLKNAALLHDIGKMSYSDDFMSTPYSKMTKDEKQKYHTHPGIGQAALLSIPALDNTGLIIRAHHERVDGTGFPDGLVGDSIPIPARIIAVAADFDDLQNGLLLDRPLSTAEALAYLKEKSGKHYDKSVVDAIINLANKTTEDKSGVFKTHTVHVKDLKPGMRTADNITDSNGMLLLSAGQELTESLILRISQCLNDTGGSELISVMNPANDHTN
ncbi:MAG: response regulator [Gammaproteobacteria bacterium]|nr:response regulator [Gammaproteobacteria bacterium]